MFDKINDWCVSWPTTHKISSNDFERICCVTQMSVNGKSKRTQQRHDAKAKRARLEQVKQKIPGILSYFSNKELFNVKKNPSRNCASGFATKNNIKRQVQQSLCEKKNKSKARTTSTKGYKQHCKGAVKKRKRNLFRRKRKRNTHNTKMRRKNVSLIVDVFAFVILSMTLVVVLLTFRKNKNYNWKRSPNLSFWSLQFVTEWKHFDDASAVVEDVHLDSPYC